jgi:type I restriction enzyme S subunit
MSSRWPVVPLGEALTKSDDWVQLHPDQKYKEVTVRLWGNGATLRREVLGAEIASESRLQVHANQFIISRIDARNGASGLIPDELEGAVVSNDFPVFTPIPDRLEPRFLGWLSKTKRFIELCKAASEGTTNRVRLKEDRFLTTTIPLPPLAEQRRLVERIDALATKIAEATSLRRQADHNVERLLISMAHRNDLSPSQKTERGWRQIELREAITLRSDPVTVRTTEKYPNLGIYSFGKGLFKKPPIDGLETSASTLYRVYAGQFIYSRLFAFEGAYGVVRPEYDGHFVSNEYPTFDSIPAIVQPTFLQAYFKMPRIWSDIAVGSKGLGDRRQRVHPEQILDHSVFLPPMAWQEQIRELQLKTDKERSARDSIRHEIDAILPSILDRAFRGEL